MRALSQHPLAVALLLRAAAAQAEGGQAEQEFDCGAGYLNWRKDWSSTKKDWCCHHRGRGCSADFNCEADPEGWTERQRDWCCSRRGIGCSSMEKRPLFTYLHAVMRIKDLDADSLSFAAREALKETLAASVAAASGIGPQDVSDLGMNPQSFTIAGLAGVEGGQRLWWPADCPRSRADPEGRPTSLVSGIVRMPSSTSHLLWHAVHSQEFRTRAAAAIRKRVHGSSSNVTVDVTTCEAVYPVGAGSAVGGTIRIGSGPAAGAGGYGLGRIWEGRRALGVRLAASMPSMPRVPKLLRVDWHTGLGWSCAAVGTIVMLVSVVFIVVGYVRWHRKDSMYTMFNPESPHSPHSPLHHSCHVSLSPWRRQ